MRSGRSQGQPTAAATAAVPAVGHEKGAVAVGDPPPAVRTAQCRRRRRPRPVRRPVPRQRQGHVGPPARRRVEVPGQVVGPPKVAAPRRQRGDGRAEGAVPRAEGGAGVVAEAKRGRDVEGPVVAAHRPVVVAEGGGVPRSRVSEILEVNYVGAGPGEAGVVAGPPAGLREGRAWAWGRGTGQGGAGSGAEQSRSGERR